MQNNIRGITGVSCGYIAAVIGAGFASGQEIISFFVKYGKISIIGIVIACLMFSLFSCAVLCTCVKYNVHNYIEFLDVVFRGRLIKNIVKILTFVFAVMSVCVMTACAAELGESQLGIRRVYGALIFTIVCGVIFFMGGRKILGINSALGAVIIFGIIFSCLFILRYREHQVFADKMPVVVSGFSYAGYNLITAGTVLSGMSRCLKSRAEAVISSAVSGFVLLLMIMLIACVLGIYYGKINLGEIPMLTMAARQNKILGTFYGAMLMFAVLTTNISNGFGVIDMASGKLPERGIVILLLAIGFSVSSVGFSALVDTAYRLCGYAGIVIVFVIIVKSLRT